MRLQQVFHYFVSIFQYGNIVHNYYNTCNMQSYILCMCCHLQGACVFVPCPKDGWVEGTIEDIERDGTLLVKLDNNQVGRTVSILLGSHFRFRFSLWIWDPIFHHQPLLVVSLIWYLQKMVTKFVSICMIHCCLYCLPKKIIILHWISILKQI